MKDCCNQVNKQWALNAFHALLNHHKKEIDKKRKSIQKVLSDITKRNWKFKMVPKYTEEFIDSFLNDPATHHFNGTTPSELWNDSYMSEFNAYKELEIEYADLGRVIKNTIGDNVNLPNSLIASLERYSKYIK